MHPVLCLRSAIYSTFIVKDYRYPYAAMPLHLHLLVSLNAWSLLVLMNAFLYVLCCMLLLVVALQSKISLITLPILFTVCLV